MEERDWTSPKDNPESRGGGLEGSRQEVYRRSVGGFGFSTVRKRVLEVPEGSLPLFVHLG